MSDDLKTQLRALKILDEIGSDNPLGRNAAIRIEELEAENFALAAGLCPHHYGDEHGHSRCKRIDELESQIAGQIRSGPVGEDEWQAQELANAKQAALHWKDRAETSEAQLASSEGEHVSLQICFDRVVKQRDAMREALTLARDAFHDQGIRDRVPIALGRINAALKST